MKLKDKTVIITGAGGGIGSALVERLFREEAKLILIEKTKEALKKLVSKYGERYKYYVCDFLDKKEFFGLVKHLNEELDEIEVLINVAGIGIYKPLETVSLKEWDNSFSLNVTAPFILTKELLSKLQKSKTSLVLNIGSGAGVIPMKNRSVYCSTKFALRGLTLSLVEEFKGKPPFFCLITLGSTLTRFGPMSLEEKIKQYEGGTAYFVPEWVADKLIEIIKDIDRKTEYVLYPGEFGFGTWKKP